MSGAASPDDASLRPRALELETERLEGRVREIEASLQTLGGDLRQLRVRLRPVDRARAQIDEIRDEWEQLHTRWWVFVLALLIGLFLAAYLFYMNLGWYADQRLLPPSSDWLLDRLPTVNVIPLLSWGWLGLHAWALAIALLYHPRRLPLLVFTLATYLFIRTLYIFLSPIGAPVEILDMRELDSLFALVAGSYTFQNEFIFSGHTAIPLLFYFFFDSPVHRRIMLAGALVMAVAVLLTHNHYTVDVLSAGFMAYAIHGLSSRAYHRWVHPLYIMVGPGADSIR